MVGYYYGVGERAKERQRLARTRKWNKKSVKISFAYCRSWIQHAKNHLIKNLGIQSLRAESNIAPIAKRGMYENV